MIVISRWAAPGASATTLGRFIFLRESAVGSERLMRHELVHVRQWHRLGVAGFGIRYLGAYAAVADAALPALGGLSASPARDRGGLGGSRLRLTGIEGRERSLRSTASFPRWLLGRVPGGTVLDPVDPPSDDADGALRRPPPPRTWRERIEDLADATGSTPSRIVLGVGIVVLAMAGAFWLLRPAPPPPEVSLPFTSTIRPWPGQHHHCARRARRARGRVGHGAGGP